MPFVQTTHNGTQRRLRLLARAPALLAAAGVLLAALPRALRGALVQVATGGIDSEGAATTAALMRSDALRVAFTLAHHEFTDLDSSAGWLDVEHFSGRCALQQLSGQLAGPRAQLPACMSSMRAGWRCWQVRTTHGGQRRTTHAHASCCQRGTWSCNRSSSMHSARARSAPCMRRAPASGGRGRRLRMARAAPCSHALPRRGALRRAACPKVLYDPPW
jgi:hypothetical protein